MINKMKEMNKYEKNKKDKVRKRKLLDLNLVKMKK